MIREDFPMSDIAELEKLFLGAHKVAITTHIHPDGDALGSSFALWSYLNHRGISSEVILPDAVPHTLRFLKPEACSVVVAEGDAATEALQKADLLVCLDYNSFSRVETLAEALRSFEGPKVLIDHHLNPDREAFDLVFSETRTSSASEVLFWILMNMPDVEMDPRKLTATSASCLLAGMTTDTNNFANSVVPSTLEMTALLLSAGVDREALLNELYNNYREQRYRLLGRLLSERLNITPSGVAYMIADKALLDEYGIVEGDTEGFVNMPLGIDKVKMSLFLKQQDEHTFRVSIRSKKGTSANALAKAHFHGGGHELAAGGKLLIPEDIPDASFAAQYLDSLLF